jgi:hypothetical protein
MTADERGWYSSIVESSGTIIVPGEASRWVRFKVEQGAEALRELIVELPAGNGLILVGEMGLTSHIADVIRRARVPARIVASHEKG